MMTNAEGLYVVPMTSGWDKRPWEAARILAMTIAGRRLSNLIVIYVRPQIHDGEPGRTKGIGVICCWNEFGEGSFIEPTREQGFAYLDMVRRVFGATGR